MRRYQYTSVATEQYQTPICTVLKREEIQQTAFFIVTAVKNSDLA
jgi:hypothetical protein